MSDGDFTTTTIRRRSMFARLLFDVVAESQPPPIHSSSAAEDDDFLGDSNTRPVCVRFEDLNLSPELMKGLDVEMKFLRPTKIQSMSLPVIVTPPYKNLVAQAPVGSGKTTCFVLGMLSRVDPKLSAPQALCLCPTREHATENMEVLLKMGKFTGITSDLCLPAADRANYIPASKRAPVTAQVVISSPATMCVLIAANKLDLSNLKIIVFEEADHMLVKGGFEKDVVRIMKQIVRWSPECQVLLFSATSSDTAKASVSAFVKDLSEQEFHQLLVKKEELSWDSFKQYKVNLLDDVSKIMVIRDKILALGDGVWQTIIYVRGADKADMLHEALVKYGYAVTTIKSVLTNKDQDKIFKEFKDGLTRILISADFLYQGFDQSKVNLVVNYGLPVKCGEPDYERYLRHVGRAGRFGRKGAVFNLLCGDMDNLIMKKIETHFNLTVNEVPSRTSDDDFKDALKNAGLM